MLDLRLYLVTCSDNLATGSSVEWVVAEAIRAGVTTVQLREKNLSTQRFLERARSLRRICEAPVKLIINDRIDIALACNADGVHLGQEDMPIKAARKILGHDAIIGISVNTVAEALAAVNQGATYLGIGTCWPTGTKAIPEHKIIGGINSNNLMRTLYGCLSEDFYAGEMTKSPVGVAVVSAIMSSKSPYEDSYKLKQIIKEFHQWLEVFPTQRYPSSRNSIQERLETLTNPFMKNCTTPLIHHITNTVVQNDCANLTLAYGCSPIMSSNVNEVEEFVQAGCLVLNLGTFDDSTVQAMKLAGRKANLIGKPIIFDPVGVGASCERRKKTNELLNHVQMSVIKGNQAEIATLARVQNKGVSSCGVDAKGEVESPEELVRQLARQEFCVVVMTGKTDWISDGDSVYYLCNGTDKLSSITGSGCMTGTSIACVLAYLTDSHEDKDSKSGLLHHIQDFHSSDGSTILAAVLGISIINVLAEMIDQSELGNSTFGPNAMKIKIIDRLYRSRKDNSLWNHILSKLSMERIS